MSHPFCSMKDMSNSDIIHLSNNTLYIQKDSLTTTKYVHSKSSAVIQDLS